MILQPLQYDGPDQTNKSYIDFRGRFPHKALQGNIFMYFSFYDYDTNSIIVEPLKIRQSKEITSLFYKCYCTLSKKLAQSKLFILDIHE